VKVAELINPDHVLLDVDVERKADLLADLANRASPFIRVPASSLLKLLTNRESLGSTGIGRGIALPHASVPGIKKPFGLFARLEKPIDFESIDGQPVDLVFLLLTPPDTPSQNVASLAAISHRLQDGALLHELRTGTRLQKVYKALVG
jgi:PTS system nitrogen regulatory IIA component